MKILFALFICCAVGCVIGCGQSKEEQLISDELVEYIELIKSETGIEFTNTDIFLAFIPKDKNDINFPIINGLCYEGVGVNIVVINYNRWMEDLNENEKISVLLHELGHCVLGLSHNEKLKADNCPESIMYPHLINTECFERHKKEYYQNIMLTKEPF